MLPMQMRLQLFLDRLPVLSKFEFLPPKKNGSSSVAYQPSQYRTLDDAGGAGGLGTLDSRGVSRASLSRLDAWHGWQRRMDTFLV